MRLSKAFKKLSITLLLPIPILGFTSCDEGIFEEMRELQEFQAVKLNGYADVNLHQSTNHKANVKAPKDEIDDLSTKVNEGTLIIDAKNDDNEWFSVNHGATIDLWANSLQKVTITGSGDVRSPKPVTADLLSAKLRGSGDLEILATPESYLTIKSNGSGDIDLKGVTSDLTINLEGSGDIEAEQLAPDSIQLNTDGSGDVKFDGQTKQLDVLMEGNGDLKAQSLMAAKVNIKTNGSGDAKITVEDELSARCYGSGDIKYFGKPTIKSLIEEGSGDVKSAK
jgi:hypothetical protein